MLSSDLTLQDLELTVEKGADLVIKARFYAERKGEVRVAFGLQGQRQLPENGTALDVSGATITATIREDQGLGLAAVAAEVAVSFDTDGTDGLVTLTLDQGDLDGLAPLQSYGWDLVLEVGGQAWRFASAKFHLIRDADERLEPFIVESDIKVHGVGIYTFIGEAPTGTATSAASWRIRRVTTVGGQDLAQAWAGGNRDYDKVWDDRAGLIYR